MLAAENDALAGGKVGGVGDVVRDLPRALTKLGKKVTVIVPSYGFLHKNNPSTFHSAVIFPFGGKDMLAELWQVTPSEIHDGVNHLILHHSEFGGEPIYFNDPPEQAFARDATKYAMFCSAAGQFCRGIGGQYLLHLHDWHTGFLFLLQQLHPEFRHLRNVHTAFTVHNAAIQGTRPFAESPSSVERWFPELLKTTTWIDSWKDPRYESPCFNPMLTAIRFAKKVNTVSPTYAREILKPSNPDAGYYGGEGLEGALGDAMKDKRLFGIINAIDYSQSDQDEKLSVQDLFEVMLKEIERWKIKIPNPFHLEASKRVQALRAFTPTILLTSITRVVEQKLKLLYENDSSGVPAVDVILEQLEKHKGIFVILGSGSREYEQRLRESCAKHPNMIFLNGYSDTIARALYATGNLYLMPSSFEPCGIGQMVAMREGQPCVVHAVGGLKDTVTDGVNGFTFGGTTLQEQADGFVSSVSRAVGMYFNERGKWQSIIKAAMSARFTWEKSAKEYIDLMYQ